jgi:hypothetical protein
MALLKRQYDKLRLKINESKSAVSRAFGSGRKLRAS